MFRVVSGADSKERLVSSNDNEPTSKSSEARLGPRSGAELMPHSWMQQHGAPAMISPTDGDESMTDDEIIAEISLVLRGRYHLGHMDPNSVRLALWDWAETTP